MKKKVKKVNGFVMNKKTGHVSYAYQQQKTNVKSIGFTHNEHDYAKKQQLDYNINPKDNSPCYVKTRIEKQKYNTYRKKSEYNNYRIHNVDKPRINKIILEDIKKRR